MSGLEPLPLNEASTYMVQETLSKQDQINDASSGLGLFELNDSQTDQQVKTHSMTSEKDEEERPKRTLFNTRPQSIPPPLGSELVILSFNQANWPVSESPTVTGDNEP